MPIICADGKRVSVFTPGLTLGLFTLLGLTCGCGSPSSKHHDLAVPDDLATVDLAQTSFDLAGADSAIVTTGSNVVPMVVDGFNGYYNVAYISIELCAPGSTTNCQTIDHIQVDTGSTGLHVISSVLSPTLLSALPIAQSGGQDRTECYTYAGGFVYGSVRSADLVLGGEKASSLPLMMMGDPSFSANVPADCAASGTETDTVATFGSNGIIGVGLQNPDCGASCNVPSTPANPTNPIYYACAVMGACASVGVPPASQLPNPVAMFATDNNGVLLEMPAIAELGAVSPTGSLIFGIGTQSNNKIAGEHVYPTSEDGTLTTTFGGKALTYSFFDSGTADFSFMSTTLPICTDDADVFCPTSTQTYSATIKGASGASGTLGFQIANADSLSDTATAYDDIGDNAFDQPDAGLFDWGLTIFYGHRVFNAIDGATTPYGNGPFYAL